MLKNIPCHLIAGPLGAGKTSLIRSLLAQRPAGERWAVLVNEFGEIGLDAALLGSTDQAVQIAEIAGGCLCCVNGLPFQVGLNRLLRMARPDRLLIEASGLGHPQQLLAQLGTEPWLTVLAVQPLVLVLDAQALAAGMPLATAQRAVLPAAGLVLLNKAAGLTDLARRRLLAQLPSAALRWAEEGQLALADLPGSQVLPGAETVVPVATEPASEAGTGQVWLDPARPICRVHQADEGWSVGWRWHPQQAFDLARVEQWLAGLDYRRAKMLLQTPAGAHSANLLAAQSLRWNRSEWQRDSRLELIFSGPRDTGALQTGLAGCLR